jgi:hypothetical protein
MIETEIFKQRNLLEQPKESDTYLSKKYAQFYQIAISDRLDYNKNKQQSDILESKQDQTGMRVIKMSDPIYNQLA